MANNLFILPKMQTPSRLVNQLQDNVRAQVNQALQSTISAASAVGQVIGAALTQTQLQAQLGGDWVSADGRGVLGSKYAAITGNNNIPTIAAAGSVNYFIRIN